MNASRRRSTWLGVWTGLGICCLAGQPALAMDITSCATTVGAGETGVLQLDLDCPSDPYAVRLLIGATLDLNGHGVRGGDLTEATVLGVGAADGSGRGFFTILGPGEIAGTGRVLGASVAGTWACIQVNDGRAVITSAVGVVDVHHCVYGVLGSSGEDPNGRARVRIDHATLHDNAADGAAVGKLDASDVNASNNYGQGLGSAAATRVRNVIANDNSHGHGVFGVRSLKGENVTTLRNVTGAESWGQLKLINVVSQQNQYFGVAGNRVGLVDSTITDNGLADILSRSLPRLVNTACETSMDFNSASWGVCENDSPSGAFVD